MTSESAPTPEAPKPAAPASEAPAENLPFPLQGGEKVLRVYRRHWFYLWPYTFLMAVYGLGGVAVAGALLGWMDFLDGTVRNIFMIIGLLWLVYWGVRVFLNYFRYQNDIWVVTNQRIVDSFKPTPFRHTLSTADLVNIQDMTIEKNGIFASMLNFGDVVCQTSGGGGKEFRMVGVPSPQDVQLMMDAERDRERSRVR